MSAKDQPQTDQKEYGDVKAAEEAQAGLDATAAMEQQNMPQVEVPPPQESQPQEQPQQQPAPQAMMAPTSLMQLIPPSLLFQNRAKPEPDRAYDVGTLWRVLAHSPDAPPMIRALAARLMGEEPK